MPYPGIQNDEALFAAVLYRPLFSLNIVNVYGLGLRTMLMTYLGTVKSLLYVPIFWIWHPSVMSVRLPVLLIGAATIWLTFVFARRALGPAPALATVVLLSTDPTYLLTGSFDWGPVALQHFFLLSATISLLAFHRTERLWYLCLGFLALGVGLWDKALFAWSIAGLAAAAALIFPKELRVHLRWRNLVWAVIMLSAGAFPLLQYNLASHGETIRANASLELRNLLPKLRIFRDTLDGSAMLGYIAANDAADRPRQTTGSLAVAARWIIDHTGPRRRSLNWYALPLSLALLPFLLRNATLRPILFFLIFLFVTWLLMALTSGAGWASHHVVLLWPFPFLFIAAVFTAASRFFDRWGPVLLFVAIALMSSSNLLVYGQHLAQFARNGGAGPWTDAIFDLSKRLPQFGPRKIYIIDWGMLNSLRLLNEGHLDLEEASYPLTGPSLDQEGRAVLLREISDPEHLFVGHVSEFEIFHGVSKRLATWAREAGYERTLIATVADRNGRPVYEIFRFGRAARVPFY